MTSTTELFALDGLPEFVTALLDVGAPWEVLAGLDSFMAGVADIREGDVHPTAVIEGNVHVAAGATVGPGACIQGPAWIGPGASVGHGAYLRGGVLLCAGTIIGHSTEIKRSLLLPGAKTPHFNYVGDSVLGREVNLGAGVKIANFHAFGGQISMDGQATGLRKLGALVGDHVSIGCNAVLSPGTIIGARTVIYNGVMVRGSVPADSIVKLRTTLEIVPRN